MNFLKSFSLFAAGLLLASSASASVLKVAGYKDSLVATIPGSSLYGSIAYDAAGNRYITRSQNVTKVTPIGVVSTFATLAGANTLGLQVVGTNLYVSTSGGGITRIALANGAKTTLTTIVGQHNGLSASADNLNLFVSSTVGLLKYNLASNLYSSTSLSGLMSGIATRADGQLLVGDYSRNRIMLYNPTLNTSSIFMDGVANVSGIAIDPFSNDVYAALDQSGKIIRASAAGTGRVDFLTVGLDPGYYPSALEFSQAGGQLSYLERSGSLMNLREITGFATAAVVPEPGTLAIFALGLAGFAALRRKRK